MPYAEFNNDGYKYLDTGHYLLFSADKSHNYLFDYIAKDLSCLPTLLEQYVSKRIDLNTLNLIRKQHQDDELNAIKEILMSAHPYYKHEYENVIIQAIGEYFNALILHLSLNKHYISFDFSEDWYIERISSLLAPLSKAKDSLPMDFYNEIQERLGKELKDDPDMEILVFNSVKKIPSGFMSEIQTQRNIANMLYLILDIYAPGLEQLTLPQRKWMYSNLVDMQYFQPKFSIEMQHSFSCFPEFSNTDRTSEAELACKLEDVFSPLRSLNSINLERNGIPANKMNYFSSAIELAGTQTANDVYTEYRIHSLHNLLYLEIIMMIESSTMIRKCRRCGKYFVVNNRKIAYCDRIDEYGLCCSAVGSQQSFKRKLETDEPLKIYNRAYKTHFARTKKGTMSQNDFRQWCDQAKSKLTEARTGKLDIDSFQAWLKK